MSELERAEGRDEVDRGLLQRSLEVQRGHVLGILDGLSDEQLRKPILPSGWTCLGMVRHLAHDVEHYWFRHIVGGQPALEDDGDTTAWQVPDDATGTEVLADYREQIARADEVIAATPLAAPPRVKDDWWGDWEVPDLRFLLLHVIAETACHAGHLDATRELLDGRQWLAL